jgi:hypothetical protein
MFKKLLSIFLSLLAFTCTVSAAQAMELTKIGTTDLTGQGIGSTVTSYTYPLRSFSLYGTAVASSAVSIRIDDVTYSATADAAGLWSTYLSNLTEDIHAVSITAASQTPLNFNLIISTASATTSTSTSSTTTSTASTTKGGTTTLPAAGALENTFLVASLALLMVGLGITLKYRDSI